MNARYFPLIMTENSKKRFVKTRFKWLLDMFYMNIDIRLMTKSFIKKKGSSNTSVSYKLTGVI